MDRGTWQLPVMESKESDTTEQIILSSLPYREFYRKRQGRARLWHIPHTAPVSTSRSLPCPILVAMAQSCLEVAECHLANV